MNEIPLVSIVIPCHNGRAFVADAIRSALEQTYPRKEIIVVDDGSTDDSVLVAKSFGASIRLIETPNQGSAEARNVGIEASNGEMLQFLDADDLLDREKLSRSVPILESDPKSMVFAHALVIEFESGKKLGYWARKLTPGMDPMVFVLTSVLQTAAPLHWKENLVAVGGFRPEMPPCDDPDLHLRLAEAGIRFRQIPDILFTARRINGSLSRSNIARSLEKQSQLAWDTFHRLRKSGQITDERVASLAGLLATTARQARRFGRRAESKELFCQARAMHPDGGLPQAYGRLGLMLHSLCGAGLTEHLVTWKRRLFSQSRCA